VLGSVLTDRFERSDVDFLVDYKPVAEVRRPLLGWDGRADIDQHP